MSATDNHALLVVTRPQLLELAREIARELKAENSNGDAALISTKELAKKLGVTTRTVQNWARAGMPHSRGIGCLLFSLRDVRAWLSTQAAKGGVHVSKAVDRMNAAKS